MRIRPATPADIPAIMQIGHRTWPTTYAFAGAGYIEHGLTTWWSQEATERMLQFTSALIAEDDHGQPIGIGNIDLRAEAAVVWKLYVLPHAHGAGAGAGSALLTELIALAGAKPVRLAYADGNERAARFYAAHGFVEIRRDPSDRPGWPGNVWLERPIDKISGR